MMDSCVVTQLINFVMRVICIPMESLQSDRFEDHDRETNGQQKLGRVHGYLTFCELFVVSSGLLTMT